MSLMSEREKVISTLEEIKSQTAGIGLDSAVISHGFIDKIIALLKEQVPAKPREERHEVKVSYNWGDEVEVWSNFYCPHCGAMIANSNSPHFPWCMRCGQAVKWNE